MAGDHTGLYFNGDGGFRGLDFTAGPGDSDNANFGADESFAIVIPFRIFAKPAADAQIIDTMSGAATGYLVNVASANGKLAWVINSGGVGPWAATTTNNLCDGAWHLGIFERNCTLTKIYMTIDNAENPSGGAAASNLSIDGGNGLTMAYICSGSSNTIKCSLGGPMHIYNRVLTTGEKTAHYHEFLYGKHIPLSPDHLALWRFDEHYGTALDDEHSNGMDGLILPGEWVVADPLQWRIFDRMKTLCQAVHGFREVRIEAGEAEEVAASKYPSCVIQMLDSDAERQASDDGTLNTVPFNLRILAGEKTEAERIKAVLAAERDLKNKILDDAEMKAFNTSLGGLTWDRAQEPYEQGILAGTVEFWTPETGRQ